ncbi:MAG: zinc/manganese transport system permease protein, partial [Frankiaceae bacterium]|nr:zinc/manganese transport system permease protein [Frankiaceae bacterium]
MLSQPFMQHALLAGTAVAVLSGVVGYFVVLRAQLFAGDALSHVAYTGAL